MAMLKIPRVTPIVSLCLIALYAGNAGADDAIRCDGKLMNIGQSRIEVLKYCGEPQDRLAYLDERVTHTLFSNVLQGTTRSTRTTGSYVETSRDAVGSTAASDPENAKTGGAVPLPQTHQHDTAKMTRTETESLVHSYQLLSTYWECKKVSVYVDEYVYNFGSGKFLTYVRFENGRLKNIKYGEYGF